MIPTYAHLPAYLDAQPNDPLAKLKAISLLCRKTGKLPPFECDWELALMNIGLALYPHPLDQIPEFMVVSRALYTMFYAYIPRNLAMVVIQCEKDVEEYSASKRLDLITALSWYTDVNLLYQKAHLFKSLHTLDIAMGSTTSLKEPMRLPPKVKLLTVYTFEPIFHITGFPKSLISLDVPYSSPRVVVSPTGLPPAEEEEEEEKEKNFPLSLKFLHVGFLTPETVLPQGLLHLSVRNPCALPAIPSSVCRLSLGMIDCATLLTAYILSPNQTPLTLDLPITSYGSIVSQADLHKYIKGYSPDLITVRTYDNPSTEHTPKRAKSITAE